MASPEAKPSPSTNPTHADSFTTPKIREDRSEMERKAQAQALGLPENASWAKIYNTQDKRVRIELARALNLSDEHDKHPGSHSWREILLTGTLGMIDTPNLDTGEILARIQQARASIQDDPALERLQQTRKEHFGNK